MKMALVVGRGGRAVRRVHGGPSIRPRAPVSQPAAGVSLGEATTSQLARRVTLDRAAQAVGSSSHWGASAKSLAAADP